MLKIEKGVPIPGTGRYTGDIPWDELALGDSVLVPIPAGAKPQSIQTTITETAKRRGVRVITRREGLDAFRVWLVEQPEAAAAE